VSKRRRLLALLEFIAAAILIAVGVPLGLYGLLLSLRAGTREQEAWYETQAMVPIVPAVIALGTAGWLIQHARGRD
jgi:hypothetical protein